jgi:hypothetical protein
MTTDDLMQLLPQESYERSCSRLALERSLLSVVGRILAAIAWTLSESAGTSMLPGLLVIPWRLVFPYSSYKMNAWQVKVILRTTVSRLVCPGVRPQSEIVTNVSFSLKFSLDSCGFVILWSLLWWQVCSLQVAVAVWPRQRSRSWVWVPWDHILLSTFFTFPTWTGGPRIYTLQGLGGPVIPPSTGFAFRRLLRLAGR